jgi:DNA-binding CsgD family transcriptional regulator
MTNARIGVYDEHGIFRLGIIACLRDDPLLTVVDGPPAPYGDRLDLAIASLRLAASTDFGCGVLVCVPDPLVPPIGLRNPVLGVLPRSTLTPPQLLAAVRAAVAGLSVGLAPNDAYASGGLDERRRHVLRMLADGASTLEMSRQLHCSERTVKALITDLKRRLHARNRAHVVAAGFRQGVI